MPRNSIHYTAEDGNHGNPENFPPINLRSKESQVENNTVEKVMALEHYKTETVPMLVPIRTQFPNVSTVDERFELYQPFMVQASRCKTTIQILTEAIDTTIERRRRLAEVVRSRLNTKK